MEASYRRLVEQIPVGLHVMALDADNSTLSISPQLERMLGFSLAEWVADPQLWRRQIHEDDRAHVLAEMAHVYTPGAGPAIAEYRMLARDGHEVWIHDEMILVRDGAGQPRQLQSVKLDISERMQAEAEAQMLSQRLNDWVKDMEQSHREMSLLHEFNSQLQGAVKVEEAFPVIADFAQLLFPAESGAVYLFGETPERVALATAWGQTPPVESSFGVDDCWALRRGRLYAAEAPYSGPICGHVDQEVPWSYLCVPLTAQGETLGILHLCRKRTTGPLSAPDAPRETLSENKQRLADKVVPAGEEGARPDAEPAADPTRILVGPLTLNCQTFELAVGDRIVMPTPMEFELLQFLMRNAGKVFTAEQLLQQVWGYPPGTGSQELVRAHVKNLRAKLEPDPRRPIYLKTIGRFGYTISPSETPEAEQA
jgi:PAS domain S-box-containing protein